MNKKSKRCSNLDLCNLFEIRNVKGLYYLIRERNFNFHPAKVVMIHDDLLIFHKGSLRCQLNE